jgi:hypothetical protein
MAIGGATPPGSFVQNASHVVYAYYNPQSAFNTPTGAFGFSGQTTFNPSTFPEVENWFTLTLSADFQGTASLDANGNASGDILQVGTATMQVGTKSGSVITCQMTSSSSSTTIPINSTQVQNNSRGTQLNYFILTLSSFFTGNIGDLLQTGSVGTSTLAQFIVVTPTITGLAANQVQCQMSNSYTGLIPVGIGTGWTTDRIVVNENADGTLTSVGTYVSGAIATGASTIVANPTDNSPSQLSIVQISTSSGVILFLVTSISGASIAGSPSITLQNINDTAGNVVVAGEEIYSLPQLPAGKMGAYGMGRNWPSLPDGVSYVASDMVGSMTGSAEYKYTDAVLYVSQNYQLANGGTFQISGSGETIKAMSFVAQLDAALGQGPLQILTDDTVFSNLAPTDMATWSQMTSPIQVEGLVGSGAISQDAVTQQNNDLIFRMADGGIQSMLMARLDYNKWGNTPISKEVQRSIENDNPKLLPFSSAVTFNNRRLETCQPVQSARGVYWQAIVSLNFDPISSLAGKAPSVWEGEWTGLNVLKIVTGTFNGSKQCFALCLSADLTQIELHKINLDNVGILDNNAQPVTWYGESSMMFKDDPRKPRQYKRLINGEFSVDKIQSNVSYSWYYRSDQNPTWTSWYSGTIAYGGLNDPGFRSRIPIGQPSGKAYDPANNRPLREGYNFQTKFVFTGDCVLKVGARFAADAIDEPEFGKPT